MQQSPYWGDKCHYVSQEIMEPKGVARHKNLDMGLPLLEIQALFYKLCI